MPSCNYVYVSAISTWWRWRWWFGYPLRTIFETKLGITKAKKNYPMKLIHQMLSLSLVFFVLQTNVCIKSPKKDTSFQEFSVSYSWIFWAWYKTDKCVLMFIYRKWRSITTSCSSFRNLSVVSCIVDIKIKYKIQIIYYCVSTTKIPEKDSWSISATRYVLIENCTLEKGWSRMQSPNQQLPNILLH